MVTDEFLVGGIVFTFVLNTQELSFYIENIIKTDAGSRTWTVI